MPESAEQGWGRWLSDAAATGLGAASGALAGIGVVGLCAASALWAGGDGATLLQPFVGLSLLAVPSLAVAGGLGLAGVRRSVALSARVAAMDSVFAKVAASQPIFLPDLQDGLALCDARGHLIAMNYALERMTGEDPGQLLGRHISQLLPGLGETSEPAWRRTSRGEVLGHAFYLDAVHGDGGTFAVEVTYDHVADPSGHRVLYALRDLSQDAGRRLEMEAKERELAQARHQAGQAGRARAAFYKGVSHELLTPLNAVVGYGELVLEALQTESPVHVASDVQRIVDSGLRLRGLIEGVLDLARVESGSEQAFLEWFPVAELVDEALRQVAEVAEAGQNELVIEGEVPTLHVHLDRSKVLYGLHVLLDNALRATERGRVSVSVSVLRDEQAVRWCVADTGQGISLVHRHAVFEAFPEGGTVAARRGGAHSVGLALARNYAHLMGGRLVLAEEASEEGCRFQLDLPVDAATSELDDPEDALDDELSDDPEEGVVLLDTPQVAVGRVAYAPKRSVTGEWVQPAHTKEDLDAAVERELERLRDEQAVAAEVDEVLARRTPVGSYRSPPTLVPPEAMPRPARPSNARLVTPNARRRRARTLLRRVSIPPDEHVCEPPTGVAERGRLLVVERPSPERDARATELSQRGWWVSCVDDAAELMHVARSKRPDVVVMDLVQGVPDPWDLRRLPHHDAVEGVPMIWRHGLQHDLLALPVADIVAGPVDGRALREVLRSHPPPIGGKLLLLADEDGPGGDPLVRVAAQRAGWSVHGLREGAPGEHDGTTFDLVLLELYSRDFHALATLLRLRTSPTWHALPVVCIVPSVPHPERVEALASWLAGDEVPRRALPVGLVEAVEACTA